MQHPAGLADNCCQPFTGGDDSVHPVDVLACIERHRLEVPGHRPQGRTRAEKVNWPPVLLANDLFRAKRITSLAARALFCKTRTDVPIGQLM